MLETPLTPGSVSMTGPNAGRRLPSPPERLRARVVDVLRAHGPATEPHRCRILYADPHARRRRQRCLVESTVHVRGDHRPGRRDRIERRRGERVRRNSRVLTLVDVGDRHRRELQSLDRVPERVLLVPGPEHGLVGRERRRVVVQGVVGSGDGNPGRDAQRESGRWPGRPRQRDLDRRHAARRALALVAQGVRRPRHSDLLREYCVLALDDRPP